MDWDEGVPGWRGGTLLREQEQSSRYDSLGIHLGLAMGLGLWRDLWARGQ